MMKKVRKWNIRLVVQAFFFVLIAIIAVNKTLAESGNGIPFFSEASLHALCPFGGVVTLYNLVTLGTFIKKIHVSIRYIDVNCICTSSFIWTSFLQLGLSAWNNTRVDRKGRKKNIQEKIQ